jgi:hypothetical protein
MLVDIISALEYLINCREEIENFPQFVKTFSHIDTRFQIGSAIFNKFLGYKLCLLSNVCVQFVNVWLILSAI